MSECAIITLSLEELLAVGLGPEKIFMVSSKAFSFECFACTMTIWLYLCPVQHSFYISFDISSMLN